MILTDHEFAGLISLAMDELPSRYIRGLDNVVVTYADQPTPGQRRKLRLHANETLYGLYEGIPLTARGAGYNLVLPDKITIFKLPMLAAVGQDREALAAEVKHTLWHEIGHFYGLNHERIQEIEDNWR